MTSVPSVFPVNVKPNVCIQCLQTPERPPLLAGCTIEDGPAYLDGELTISVTRLPAFLNAISFNETKPGGKRYAGKGNMNFQNLQRCAIFSTLAEIDRNASKVSVTFLEYANIQHCLQISNETKGRINETIDFFTRGPTYTRKVQCDLDVNVLTTYTLEQSIGLYRMVQFQYSLHPLNHNEEEMRYERLTVDDIYRAVLALRLAESSYETGEYFEYSECGQYDWIYLLPFIGSFVILAFLGCIALLFSSYDGLRIFGRRRGLSQDFVLNEDQGGVEKESKCSPLSRTWKPPAEQP